MNRRNAHFLVGLIAASMLIVGCGGNAGAPNPVSTASPAASPKATTGPAQPLAVKEVVDVKVVKDQKSGERMVQGSIVGTGLREGNMVVINKDATLGTVFGNPTWITFSVPLTSLGAENSFTLEVVDPATKEQSQPFTVNFKR